MNGPSLNASGASATPFSDRLSRGTQLSMSQKGGIAGGTIIAGVIVVTLVTVAAINSAHLIYIIVSLVSTVVVAQVPSLAHASGRLHCFSVWYCTTAEG